MTRWLIALVVVVGIGGAAQAQVFRPRGKNAVFAKAAPIPATITPKATLDRPAAPTAKKSPPAARPRATPKRKHGDDGTPSDDIKIVDDDEDARPAKAAKKPAKEKDSVTITDD